MRTTGLCWAAVVFCLAVPACADGPVVGLYSHSDENLFPSALISTALVDWNGDDQVAQDKADTTAAEDDPDPLYGDENGWIGITLEDVPEEANIEVEIAIDGYLKTSKWTGQLKPGQTKVRILPKAAWDYDKLHQVKEETPVVFTASVTVNDEALPPFTETLLLKSLNDCLFYVLLKDEPETAEDIDDLSWLFAAYVNENHPWIDGVLKDAKETGIVDSFTGYQSGDPAEVMKQVLAVWAALQGRNITYSDVSTTTPNKGTVSQSVRFLDESIEATQANCVDGSVLMASILRKIGLDVELVMVPGHCFLAFKADKKGELRIGLETTMLGTTDAEVPEDLPDFFADLSVEGYEAEHAAFVGAVLTGLANLDKHKEAFEANSNPNIQLISIEEARDLGIRPIASKRKK